MAIIHSYKVNVPRVTRQTIDNETIVIDLQTGHYYSLTGAGSEIWGGVEAGCSSDEIAARVASRYAGDADAIVRATDQLLDALVREALIVALDARETSASVTAAPLVSNDLPLFEPPALEKFTDMQDLLLLDPIHEVDEAGWPTLKPSAGISGQD